METDGDDRVAADDSPAPLVLLAGGDDTLCIDDGCVAAEVTA